MNERLRLLSGSANVKLAGQVAELLGTELCQADAGGLTPGRFPDGEVRVEVQQTVRGKEVFVIQPTSPPVNENLMELLLLIDALKRASAQMVCAVIPYFGYARQDRKKRGRVPISARLVANLLETAGVDRVLTVELHASQIQGFFNVPVDHLRTDKLFADYVRQKHPNWLKELVVVSPDIGGVWRARRLAKELECPLAIVEKHRRSTRDEEPEVYNVIGHVAGRNVLLVDDILATGKTLYLAAELLKKEGAQDIFAAVTHAIFTGDALESLDVSPLQKVLVTDTIAQRVEVVRHPKVEVVSVAKLLADAIGRIFSRRSVSDLLVRS
ncbi:ribose-phosphate pyrophosphokinase [Candidatus Bipolaricaulota bacterium]|nr:ribose-phosphate pyrophosphokinase [Candidatus Bipolaricaulota bacterium]